MGVENETKCPNCSGIANRFEYKGKRYIECDDCGTLEIDSAGEAKAVGDLKINATGAPTAGSEADSAQRGSGTGTLPGPSPDSALENNDDENEPLLEISIDDSED